MRYSSLLSLLQLVSPALPVGAYSYSEGLETFVQTEQIQDSVTLEQWLTQELCYGVIRVEAAVLVRAYRAAIDSDLAQLQAWNQWLSAFRETEEIREQSWQMGRSLVRLLKALPPEQALHHTLLTELTNSADASLNFAIGFAIAAASWQIELPETVLGYLQSWAANLVNAGVRLVPLGQTQGQQILFNLQAQINQTGSEVLQLNDHQLECCSWGSSMASMQHETLYSRLFRS
jgi:urease accessory protein